MDETCKNKPFMVEMLDFLMVLDFFLKENVWQEMKKCLGLSQAMLEGFVWSSQICQVPGDGAGYTEFGCWESPTRTGEARIGTFITRLFSSYVFIYL
jgi:hypothetical protein